MWLSVCGLGALCGSTAVDANTQRHTNANVQQQAQHPQQQPKWTVDSKETHAVTAAHNALVTADDVVPTNHSASLQQDPKQSNSAGSSRNLSSRSAYPCPKASPHPSPTTLADDLASISEQATSSGSGSSSDAASSRAASR